MTAKKKTAEEVEKIVSKAIAAALPAEFIQEAVHSAVREYVAKFKINDYEIQRIVFDEARELVAAKVRELLKINFEKELTAKALDAASRVIRQCT